jgi:Tfp pilus assembly major pilin PilA
MTNNLKNYRVDHKTQNGFTLTGLVVISALLIVIALVGMKVVPAYMEFLSVKKVLTAMKQEPLDTMSKSEIMKSFDKRANIAYISVVKGSDLTIEKTSTGTVVNVEYQVIRPIAGNLSVLIDFSTANNPK